MGSLFTVRKLAIDALTQTPIAHLFRPLTRGSAVVFMLHRFNHAGRTGYFDPATLRSLLAFLRTAGYNLVDLRSVLRGLQGDGPRLERAVAFTIDDGYAEQATVAAPLFAEFDCPVTTFVTSGFLDRALWFWWDQIEFVFAQTRRQQCEIEIGGSRVTYDLRDAGLRVAAQQDFTTRCKTVPDVAMRAAIARLATAAEVEVPRAAPPQYAPMTWDELRTAERGGMTFGPHTVTHPVLAHTDDAQCEHEISQSWNRLRVEARDPVPVFAYPNGGLTDFGGREIAMMKRIGLVGGCTGEQAYATSDRYHAPDGAFYIPRFAFPDDLSYLRQYVTGLERFKQLLRGVN
jgi:peptidoglycan/xylan/chitin deacetylase (PgdA/CDA1 family)